MIINGQEAFASYRNFSVAGGFENYRIATAGFKGMPKVGDILTSANGLEFVAPSSNEGMKCVVKGGGWWFSEDCVEHSLNGIQDRGSTYYTELKIRKGK